MASRSQVLSGVAVGVALLCAVIMTAAVVVRVLLPQYHRQDPGRPVRVADWEEYVAHGRRIGPADAPVTVLVFLDFQCPACRVFALEHWPRAHQRYRGQVALVVRHWPLSYHRRAYELAIAAECAGAQGRFAEYHDVLFQQQMILDGKDVVGIAHDANVPDSVAFRRCVDRSEPREVIERDIAAARQVGGKGTPTLVINGFRYQLRADTSWLSKLVDSLIAEDADHR